MDKQYFLKRLTINRPSVFKKNLYDTLPASFLAHDKLPIECLQHGVFYQRAYTHLNGADCPECGKISGPNNRANTTEEFIALCKNKYGDRFDYSKTVYKRKDEPLTLTCHRHGDIKISPNNLRRIKHGCLQCSTEISRAFKRKQVLSRAVEIHGSKYDYSRVVFVNVNDKVEILCPSHGSFWQGLHEHTAKRNGCPHCAVDKMRLTTEKFLLKAKTVHHDRYDYSKVHCLSYAEKVTITCKKHGDFEQHAGSHLTGCICRKCYIEEMRNTTNEFIKNAKQVHGNCYDYSKTVYRTSKQKVEIICHLHGSFLIRPNSHVSNKQACPFCAESKGEHAIRIFLEKYNIPNVSQYSIKPHRYRFDFYLNNQNIFIEFNGVQHYKPSVFFGGVESFKHQLIRDKNKRQLVSDHGGTLIIVSYLSLNDGKLEKVLIQKLKKAYVRWYKHKNELLVFKTMSEVYDYFNIPHSVSYKDLDRFVQSKVPDLVVLF